MNVLQPPTSGTWLYEQITSGFFKADRIDEILLEVQTPHQNVMIVDSELFGRELVLDGKIQSSELDEFVYHEALVHPAMIAHPDPKNIFIAGGGEGATAREVLSHKGVNAVLMVDLDSEVIEICRKYLPNHHNGAFLDDRLKVCYSDALTVLQSSEDRYDVIIIDVTEPLGDTGSYLFYTKEFYELAQESLAENGYMVVQAGPTGPAFYDKSFLAVANTIGSVFPVSSAYEAFVPSFGTTWGFVIGSQGSELIDMTISEIDSRLFKRVKQGRKFYDGTCHYGMFSLPLYLRNSLEQESRVITTTSPLSVN
tara:strand:- start:1819 stop:2748 length:930 start_codon:yes stop_codon:yes gene_type:complete